VPATTCHPAVERGPSCRALKRSWCS
jgi:hypothetical protein